jgi:hypothetical protein
MIVISLSDKFLRLISATIDIDNMKKAIDETIVITLMPQVV